MDLLSTNHKEVVDCPRYKRLVVVDGMCEECIYAGEPLAPKTKIWCKYLEEHKEFRLEIEEQYKNYYNWNEEGDEEKDE